MTRIAVTAASVLALVLLTVPAASARSLGQAIDVPCTGQAALVAAINSANSAGGGTINLPAGCHIELLSANNGENGLPVVTTPIVVNGNHSIIDGESAFRVFEVDGPGGKLWLRDVRIALGSVSDLGGGIANFGGTVRLNSSEAVGNVAGDAGGGIANVTVDPSSVARLLVIDSALTGNSQTSDDPAAIGGGAIANLGGTATIIRSHVEDNDAFGPLGVQLVGGGGIVNGDYLGTGGVSRLTLDSSVLKLNTSIAGAGGIENLGGSVTLNNSKLTINNGLDGGGIVSRNGPHHATARLLLHHSQLINNRDSVGVGGHVPAVAGGGIASDGYALLDHSLVEDNSAHNGIGAGIVNRGVMTLKYSQVSANTESETGVNGSAAGILNAQGPHGSTPALLTLVHTRVLHNVAGPDGYGGGIANGVPVTGPMQLIGGTVVLKHSLVAANTAAHGGGIFNNLGIVKLLNGSKVTGNTPDNCEPPVGACT
jgi:hypothetical protein